MIKGCLKIVVLRELMTKSCYGSELMDRAEVLLGKRPSAGSLYPLMKGLLAKGIVSVRHDGAQKLYSITPKGRKIINKLITEKKKIIEDQIDLLYSVKGLLGEKNTTPCIKVLKSILKRDFLSDNLFLILELSQILFDAYETKNKERVMKIVTDTKEKLMKL